MIEVKAYLSKFIAILPVGTSIGYTEAEKRAGQFLEAAAYVSDIKHEFSKQEIEFITLSSAVYDEELSKCVGKTITENKVKVEASAVYADAREGLESVKNDISYLKAHYDIFMAAHVFYRKMAGGDNS